MKFLHPLIATLVVAFLASLPSFDAMDRGTFELMPALTFVLLYALLATWHLYLPRRPWSLVGMNLVIGLIVLFFLYSPLNANTDPYTHMDTSFASIGFVVSAAIYAFIVFATTASYEWTQKTFTDKPGWRKR